MMEENDLNRYVTSINDARLELTMGNSRNTNLTSANSPSSSRQDPWQYQYDLANGFMTKDSHGDFVSVDKDQILLRIKQEFKMQNMKRSSSKHIGQDPDEVSANPRVDDDKIISNNALLIGKKQPKTNSACFSRLPLEKTLKEKGIISRYQEACSVVMDQNDEKLGYDTEVASSSADAKSSGKNFQNFSTGVLKSSSPESNISGISLREWLKTESCKSNKVKSLVIFRQIVKLVDFAHSQGSALQDLRPSCFTILPSKKIQYTGSLVMREISAIPRGMNEKRPLEENVFGDHISGRKQQKLREAMRSLRNQHNKIGKETEFYVARPQILNLQKDSRLNPNVSIAQQQKQQQSVATTGQLEKKWYNSPEELDERGCTFSSNMYGLGVLLFELLFYSESSEAHSAAMSDLHHRILPPKFLAEHRLETGFCLRLLHPEPLSRPTTREILQYDLISGPQDSNPKNVCSISADNNDPQSELLLSFFSSLEDEKERHASKLIEDIGCLEEDIKEIERRYLSKTASVSSSGEHKERPSISEESSSFKDLSTLGVPSGSFSVSKKNEGKLMKNITQLEHAYFTTRSQIWQTKSACVSHSNKDVVKKEPTQFHLQNGNAGLSTNQVSDDPVGSFFDGLCKFARYSEFKVCGTLRNGDLFNSTNAICSLSFDRDEEYIAAAKVSKKIKIFEFGALSNETSDIHYPVVEMSNKSTLSCICWNYYIKNYLASTDYDGVIWDAGTGEGFSEYTEHQKRAWSIDFSRGHPTMFASGSDDCSKSSIGTIWSPANVCCVQFSDYSNHQLVFGSADYKIYSYDLRHVRIPLCTLSGHGKAVSYVKFLDADTLVSASTDNTLKLWDLKNTISSGSDDACSLSFKGHTNEKNFVGLSVLDGYIVCGSETNEVYGYYRSLPMPITSYKFKTIDPVSGNEISDDGRQFVSSVCWRRKSNMVVAANSSGVLKLLQMV
ncbi:hypothetical protein TIFTF001_012172 [Ficus carica]|uniref:Uncharacterized protein n=1 Tax=Ficus carica TaxID=3494 RepID=A0AA88D507_FICCA|nr:hypothetical protein TIFTF001_012172 [Ficus carica]